ncbi:response regulator [Siccirubricoccus sp. KC 17139]|uniref:Response regulator n=1 Tax=Siccirubricoccus soli TaxID=2899147 RepID=A0ABT1D357_9PROT|nr:response regulator [Siccirubricoccus soli]MCO6416363.1 response regulator [Siccirubricoccus soli]MCP2682497.1 response regulator [Siccirubricoccus soli]
MTERDGPALRVLVAEDEALAAMVLEDILAEAGHQVVMAPDGEVALRLARESRFDLLLTDLAMPRLTGWDLIYALRQEQPDLPVVVMTGYLPPGGREVLYQTARPPRALLHKPFDIGELLTVLDGIAPRPAAGRAPLVAMAPRLAS